MKERVQKFGRFLSGMVMPNIGAFIAWGLIAAFFIPDGWFPNDTINGMVGPMLRFLLPILIGYTGGKAVGGQKGAVTGALATLGAIAATESTMFIGAMICGPLGGWCIKKFDKAMEGHIPAGFEMVVNNFSVGIIGAILAILSIYVIAPLTAVLVEPAKVLFLNNAINHGVFTPIGTEQAMEMGKSILFMIESNPGPGLGLLLAYCVAGKGETRSSAGAAAVIQFVGGIHEIYFPYVLMNPIVILGPMIGNIVGIFTLSALGGGLAAAASPGSIIAEMLMTPKGGYLANIAGIGIAAVVSFLISVFLLKFFGKDASLEEAQAQVAASKGASKGQAAPAASAGASVSAKDVRKIVFACDAGMGSSAMGATMVRNKLKDAGITDIEVIHFPVGEIPGDCQIVVTHHELSGRAAQRAPQARIIPIKNFMGAPEYNTLVQELLDARKGGSAPAAPATAEEAPAAVEQPILLEKKNIVLNCKPVSPEEAIKAVGKRMMESGYVEEAYIQGMLDREASFSVAIGSHVAIPHGTEESRKAIKKTGLIVMTYPEGIEWGDETVRLVVGIASTGEDHLGILGKIVEVAETEEDTDALVDNASVDQLYKLLNGLE